MNQCGLLKGCGFELVWAIESVWVGCFGGAGMCMVVEASLNRCGLVISDSGFCGFDGCVTLACNRAPLHSYSFSQTSP